MWPREANYILFPGKVYFRTIQLYCVPLKYKRILFWHRVRFRLSTTFIYEWICFESGKNYPQVWFFCDNRSNNCLWTARCSSYQLGDLCNSLHRHVYEARLLRWSLSGGSQFLKTHNECHSLESRSAVRWNISDLIVSGGKRNHLVDFLDLTVHKVECHSNHFELIDQ